MKILFVIDDFVSSNNGTTISCRRFANELRRQGHEVRILGVCDKNEKDTYPLEKYDFPIVEPLLQKYDFHFPQLDMQVIRQAIEWADLVHCMMPFALTYRCIPIIRELHKPATSAFHIQPENMLSAINAGKWSWLNDLVYRVWNKMIYSHFVHVHCPSPFMARELREHGYKNDIRAISNGISSAFVEQKHYKSPAYEGKIVITMVGRLAREKRQDLIIRAAAKSQYADQIQLVFAGKGPLQKEYERLSQRIGLKHRPAFVYYNQEQLIDLLAQTDVYVHASDMESEAIACIEAFATGVVPVISNSELSATKSFALDNRSLFEAGDAQDLANKIDYWLNHPQDREIMGKRYANEAKKYSLERSVESFVDMCEDMLRLQSGMAMGYEISPQLLAVMRK